jgi:hypothetical protein
MIHELSPYITSKILGALWRCHEVDALVVSVALAIFNSRAHGLGGCAEGHTSASTLLDHESWAMAE